MHDVSPHSINVRYPYAKTIRKNERPRTLVFVLLSAEFCNEESVQGHNRSVQLARHALSWSQRPRTLQGPSDTGLGTSERHKHSREI